MEKLILPAIHLFGLVAFIIYKTKGSFFSYLSARHKEVYEGLNRSKIQAQAAAQKRAELEKKLQSLDSLKEEILNEWAAKKEAATKAIQESSARLLVQMKKEAEQNKKSLELSIQKATLEQFKKNILSQAETKINQTLNPGVHQKVNERFLSEVARG